MEDLISVLVPVYNVKDYVLDAIDSLLHQTYKNLEIIIVDDCSTDGTYELLLSTYKDESRVRLFRNKKNQKIAETLNYALSKANGTYIGRMDGDDICDKTKFEKQYLFLKSHPEVALVGTGYCYINQEGKVFQYGKVATSSHLIKKLLPYQSPVPHIWLTTKEVYDRVGNYRMPGVEDYDFLLRLHSIGLRCSNLPDNLYSIRIRDGNTISSLGFKQAMAAAYAYNLYRERKKYVFITDSFSILDFQKVIDVSRKKEQRYFNFMNYYMKVRIQKNTLYKGWYLLKSLILFPAYATKYLKNRLFVNCLFKRYNW